MAYFNININLALGDLMVVIQKCLQRAHPIENLSQFYDLFSGPASKLLTSYLAQSTFTFVYLYSLFVLAEQTASRLRIELFGHFLGLELPFFDTHRDAGVVNTLSNDVQEFKSSFKQLISLGIKNSAQIVGSFVTLYRISPEMTIVINLVVIPTIALVGSQLGAHLRKLSRALQQQIDNVTNVALEAIGSIRTVKILNIEQVMLDSFAEEVATFDKLNEKFSAGFAAFQASTNLALNGIVLLTLLFGGHHLLTGTMNAGHLMSYLTTTQTIQRSLFQLSLLYGHYIKSTTALMNIFNYLAIPLPDLSGVKLADFRGSIELSNITFHYPSRPDANVFKDFSIKFEPGKVTALCGPSGGGKSTIALLIETLYNLDAGTVLIDGIDISRLDRNWLRRHVIGYISQEPILFHTSIMENIRLGRREATDEEVIEAAKLANAHDFINAFPDGYHTTVGARGVNLSGGQRQRVSIARAIVKNPKILVLDEATSSLDNTSEAAVKEALANAMAGRTVIVIAHRLSTIESADRIVLIDRGQIVESGSHAELMAAQGRYYHLVNRTKAKTATTAVTDNGKGPNEDFIE